MLPIVPKRTLHAKPHHQTKLDQPSGTCSFQWSSVLQSFSVVERRWDYTGEPTAPSEPFRSSLRNADSSFSTLPHRFCLSRPTVLHTSSCLRTFSQKLASLQVLTSFQISFFSQKNPSLGENVFQTSSRFTSYRKPWAWLPWDPQSRRETSEAKKNAGLSDAAR